MMTDKAAPPHALFIRGPSDEIFALSDTLGFESPMDALAVSVFEDGPQTMHVQALYETQAEAEAALKFIAPASHLESFITQLDDIDWVTRTQQNLPPVHAGRFWVHGDHDDPKEAPSGAHHPICINAGMAFGTGHHGTTKGCLLIYNDLIDQGVTPGSVLDLGCGAGTLAIAAAKQVGREILATDIDQDAVDVTTDNARINGVGPLVNAVLADGFKSPALAGKKFDLVFANILAGPLIRLAPDIRNAMADNGYVILSGILNEQAEQVAAGFKAAGIDTMARPPIGEWTSLLGRPARG